MGPSALLVGLGNPGAEYARNRHNIGFLAAEEIARRYGFAPFRGRFQGDLAAGRIEGRDVLLLKPMTFMNESGRSVAQAARFYKLPLAELTVIHDELDLPAGRLRVKRGGGAAGHNGLRSIDAHLGPDYRRIRLGIGHPGDKSRVLSHVLNDFAKADDAWLGPLLEALARNIGLILDGDDAGFASRVALALEPLKPRPDRAKPSSPSGAGDGV
jgi:PTH1 family peptidyl-tRNA hydrolase